MYVFPREHRADFFKQQLNIETFPANVKILDVGGNSGNLITDLSNEGFPQQNYTCLDVDTLPIKHGKQLFPHSTWIHYDAFNQVYNKEGVKCIPYPLDNDSFDFVFAYSVHSHTTLEQFVFDLEEMYRVLKPGGKAVTTLVDYTGIKWFLMKRLRTHGTTASIDNFVNLKKFKYLIDSNQVVDEYHCEEVTDFVAVYNLDWVQDYLTSMGFNVKINNYPVKGYNQKGLVLNK